MKSLIPKKIYELKNQLKEINFDNAVFKEIKKGRNSLIYEINSNNKKFIIKFYPEKEFIKRNRIENEYYFLNLLNNGGYNNVPKPIKYDLKKKWMLMTFLEGNNIKHIRNIHYQKLFKFILDIQKLKDHKLINHIKNASEAEFCIYNHFHTVKERLKLFDNNFNLLLIKDKSINDSIKLILQNLNNRMEYIRNFKLTIFDEEQLKKTNENHRILSQSDIGFHNIFEDINNKLLFFDFEYAGWDDICKMFSDIILHPDWRLSNDKFYLLDRLINIYILSREDLDRLYLTCMIYRVKWSCIILNPIFKLSSYSKFRNKEILKIIEKSNSYFVSTATIEEDFYSYLSKKYF